MALRVQTIVARVRRADEPRDLRPGALVGGGRPLGRAGRCPRWTFALYVAVVVVHRLDDRARLLRGRRGVEVDQPVPVDLLVEDREVGPERGRVERGRAAGRVVGRVVGRRRRSYRPAPAASGSMGSGQRLVRDADVEAVLAQDRAVALVLEAQRQVLAARGHDPAGRQHVDDVRRDVVEQPLVVRDQQHAHVRVEHAR